MRAALPLPLPLLLALGLPQTLATYRVQHRPAADLLTLAETAMGAEGGVTLDARTSTLVLNGSPGALKRALALLAQMDRPLGTVTLTSGIVERQELERLGIRVEWRASSGSFAVGTLPLGAENLRVALDAGRSTARSRSSSRLALLEGASGVIATGEMLAFLYRPYPGTRAVDFLPAETGVEATATRLGDGRVRLELHPFSGRLSSSGGLRYTSAATELIVSPGSTVVLGELGRTEEGAEASLAGAGRNRREESAVLIVSVDVEEP